MLHKPNAWKAIIILIVAASYLFFNYISNRREKNNVFSYSHLILYAVNNASGSTTNESNVYTIIYGSDNSTVQDVRFNIHNSSLHKSNDLLIESSDFKLAFFSDNYSVQHNIHFNNSEPNVSLKICPLLPTNINGPFSIDMKEESMEMIEQRISYLLEPGGFYKTKICISRYRVAIIVPFRDRYLHLPIFLKNIHKFLMKQQIDYKIFVIEQIEGKPFNRAALLNIGFLEATKLCAWDCFIFHDVDLLPLDDRNLYTCPDQPRHMSAAVDIFGFKLPYTSIFGGVSSVTAEQFKAVNGFSNSFWGWGGEDDDFSNRLKHANLHISRYPLNIARYMMLNHKKQKANPKRYENLATGVTKFNSDGLNSVKYIINNSNKFPLYTWFLVEIKVI